MNQMEKSKSNWTYGIILILFAATFSGVSQSFWKAGALDSFKGVVLLGFGLLISLVGALLMMIAFRFGEVSVLHPMMSFGVVLSVILGNIIFNESITASKIIGTLFIVIGLVLLIFIGRQGEAK